VLETSLLPSLASKCMRWASALLGRPIQAGEQVDFESLIGKRAVATVVRKRKEDGTEYNAIEELLPDTGAGADPFASCQSGQAPAHFRR